MAAPPGTMMITVPPNTAPGATLQVTAPNGQPLMVPVPPGHGPGSSFAVRVPGPPAPPAQPTVVSAPGQPVAPQPTYAPQPGMPVPPQPTPAQNYAALAAANAPPPQTAPLPTPAGPCLLVDHIHAAGSRTTGQESGQVFAGYVADDLDGAGAKPAFAAEISWRAWEEHAVPGLGDDVPQGLVVPIYPSSVDPRGRVEWKGSTVAELHLDNVGHPACKCNEPLSAKVTKDGKTYEIASESGRCLRLCVCVPCQGCCKDSDMTLGEGSAQVRLGGARTRPCCPCGHSDTRLFRSVQGEAKAGMRRVCLTSEAAMLSNKNTRKSLTLRGSGRDSGVVINLEGTSIAMGKDVAGKQAYSIRLPAKNALPPEVWFAATIFETIAYPYHKMRLQAEFDPLAAAFGAPCGMEMTR